PGVRRLGSGVRFLLRFSLGGNPSIPRYGAGCAHATEYAEERFSVPCVIVIKLRGYTLRQNQGNLRKNTKAKRSRGSLLRLPRYIKMVVFHQRIRRSGKCLPVEGHILMRSESILQYDTSADRSTGKELQVRMGGVVIPSIGKVI